MSSRNGGLVVIVALLNLHCPEIWCDESSEEAYPNYEYTQIFKGVPALFEYLLSTLEEKPEILEKNDINVFKRTIDLHGSTEKEEKSKRAVELSHEICEKEQLEHKRSTDIKINDYKEPPSTVAYEYGNRFLLSSLDEDNCKVVSKREVQDDVTIVTKNKKVKDKIRKRDVDTDFESYSDISQPGFKENEQVVWDSEEGYAGFQNLFGLDVQPEEIEQSILMTEKLLEDFNEKRMKTKEANK